MFFKEKNVSSSREGDENERKTERFRGKMFDFFFLRLLQAKCKPVNVYHWDYRKKESEFNTNKAFYLSKSKEKNC